MSAERGWIADPPPQREHHTPGWLSEKGTGRSHFHSDKYAAKQEEEDALRSERGWMADPQPAVEWRDSHYSRQADRITNPDHEAKTPTFVHDQIE